MSFFKFFLVLSLLLPPLYTFLGLKFPNFLLKCLDLRKEIKEIYTFVFSLCFGSGSFFKGFGWESCLWLMWCFVCVVWCGLWICDDGSRSLWLDRLSCWNVWVLWLYNSLCVLFVRCCSSFLAGCFVGSFAAACVFFFSLVVLQVYLSRKSLGHQGCKRAWQPVLGWFGYNFLDNFGHLKTIKKKYK